MRYGYDSEYRRRRHGTYGATSSAVPSTPVPVPLVLTRCAIKWSKRAGVRKFDDEVEEKEAKEDEGREGRSSEGPPEDERKGRVKERKVE